MPRISSKTIAFRCWHERAILCYSQFIACNVQHGFNVATCCNVAMDEKLQRNATSVYRRRCSVAFHRGFVVLNLQFIARLPW